MDVSKLRKDFSLYATQEDIIYFDNACATLKPEAVLAAMDEYNRNFPTCGGRSINRLGEWVTKAVDKSRTLVAGFINAQESSEVLFVRNTTEGINLLTHSLEISAGDIILTTDKEHNSNLVPWQLAAKRSGAEHRVVRTHSDGQFDMEAFEAALQSSKVRIVAMGMTSNLDGVSIPAEDIIKKAHAYNALVVLDAAQSAPHHRLDVQQLDVDFLVFSGHKLCGPSGTGVVYGKRALLDGLQPFIAGGSTVSETTYTGHTFLAAPEKFEGGTQDYAGIIGLGAAVDYVTSVGLEEIAAHQVALNSHATKQLHDISDVHIIGPADPALRGGILSLYVPGVDIHQMAVTLDTAAGVQVRSGQHCVHSWFNDRGIHGSVRASFYLYNTTAEVDRFVSAVKDVVAIYK